MFCSYTFWLACLIPDIDDSWNDRHKWNNRQNRSRSVHVLLVYRVAKLSSHVHALAVKMFRKFQEILATAMKSISRKGSFLKLVNVLWKRTLPQFCFYNATLISSKLWTFLVYGYSFSIHCSGEIFPFSLTFPNEGCSCAA